jgi:hypothetical protein
MIHCWLKNKSRRYVFSKTTTPSLFFHFYPRIMHSYGGDATRNKEIMSHETI